jgi:hemoglobin/transferrin/lactoferrin receptor protein
MKWVLLLCLCCKTLLALAQSVDPDSTYVLDELIISANKIPELRSKIARQIHVISSAEIKNLDVQTTADLLSNSGTVAIQKSQQGGGSAQIRGFEASRVLLVVDGIRMNNLIYRGGHLQNMITLDNNSLERVEILFGPSSTVYGSDALGGVIHFKTLDPKPGKDGTTEANGNALFRYGSVNAEKTAHLDVNIGGQQFASLTSFTFSDFGDLRMGERTNRALGEPFGLRNFYVQPGSATSSDQLVPNRDPYIQRFSGYSQYDILQKFLYKQNDRITHVANLQYSTSSDIPRYDRLTDRDGTGLRNAEWYYGPQQRLLVGYHVNVSNPGRWADALKATFSYQNIVESRHDRRFNQPIRRNQFEYVQVWGLNMDLSKAKDRHNLRYGFDAQFNEANSDAHSLNIITGEKTAAATRYPDGLNRMNLFGIYGTHTYEISDRLSVLDGLRIGFSDLHAVFKDKTFFPFPFDDVKQRNVFVSGNAGVIFKTPHAWQFTFFTSTGYRVPNIDDLAKVFDSQAGASLIVPNPEVQPEKTVNLELGVTRYLGEKLRWENVFFYTMLFDAIVLDHFTFDGRPQVEFQGQPTPVFANQNKKKAYVTGFSSVVHGVFSSNFSADASFTYTYGRIRSSSGETPLDHIPPTFGRVSFQYQPNKFRTEVFANFNGWKKIDDYLLNAEDNEIYAPAEGMPSWYTINFRVAYTFNSHVTAQAGIDNLMDLQYRTFSSGINAAGRNVFASVKLMF